MDRKNIKSSRLAEQRSIGSKAALRSSNSLVGSEKRGLSDQLRQACTTLLRVLILRHGIDSFNGAVAVRILLYEHDDLVRATLSRIGVICYPRLDFDGRLLGHPLLHCRKGVTLAVVVEPEHRVIEIAVRAPHAETGDVEPSGR